MNGASIPDPNFFDVRLLRCVHHGAEGDHSGHRHQNSRPASRCSTGWRPTTINDQNGTPCAEQRVSAAIRCTSLLQPRPEQHRNQLQHLHRHVEHEPGGHLRCRTGSSFSSKIGVSIAPIPGYTPTPPTVPARARRFRCYLNFNVLSTHNGGPNASNQDDPHRRVPSPTSDHGTAARSTRLLRKPDRSGLLRPGATFR